MRRLLSVAAVLLLVACGTTSQTASVSSPSPSPTAASPSPGSSPTPVPSPPPDYGPPPAGVDLLYLQWPAAPAWLVGYDWQGRPSATIHLAEVDGHTDAIGSGIVVAPNGGGFLSSPYTFDRLGHVVYQGPPPSKGNLNNTWTEDGSLVCGVEEENSAIDSNGNGTSDYYLVRRLPTGPQVRVTRFLHLDSVPGDMGFSMVACSHSLNRALIVRTVCCGIQGAMVLRLSDGALLGTWTRGSSGSPVFSPDGQEVAEPTWTADGKTVSTEVRLILDGTVMARYGVGVDFKAFSANNRLAVVDSGGQTQVIEVATRRVLWSDTQGRTLSRVWPRPGTGDMMLAFTAPPVQMPCPEASSSPCTNPLTTEVIVHADGSSVALDGEHLVPMAWG